MNRRKHAFTTAVALAATFAAGSALAIAESEQNLLAPDSATEQSAAPDDSAYAISHPLASDSSGMSAPSERSEAADDSSSYSSDEAMDSDDGSASDTDRDDSDASASVTVEPGVVTTEPSAVLKTEPLYVGPGDEPRYTPETGDAEYGSKLNPQGPAANRFNDATGS